MGAHASPRWAHFLTGGWAHFHTYVWAHLRVGAHSRTYGRTYRWAHMLISRQLRYGRTCEPPGGRTLGWAHTCKPSSRNPSVTVTLGSGQGDALFRHFDVMQVGALARPRETLRLGLDAILRGVL